MKARVKATGKIIEVEEYHKYLETGWKYKDNAGMLYKPSALDFSDEAVIGYWTRLEHQAAIAAMQGMLNNSYLAGEFRKDPNNGIEDMSKIITKAAAVYAHALVEKMKNKEE